ncbi:MAG TPA: hypothetical protein VFE51_09265 [Verrucomicrobiae bacterium]|nr:hypothetical protein [Verrucomicrobiae bacterium]
MTSQSTIRKLLGGGLAALGIFLECSSCNREVLRDGNEPIAGGLGLLGLFCIGAGWIAYRTTSELMPERRRVRQCLLFEHVAYCAGLLMVWLLGERQPFFVDTPFGRDILALHTTLEVILGAVIWLSVALRVTLRKSEDGVSNLFPFPRSLRARQSFAIGLLVIGTLNVVQGTEIIHLSNGMHVSISSRGFPLPAFQKLRVYVEGKIAGPGVDQGIVLTMPNGTLVGFRGDTITILRYSGRPKQLNKGVHTAELSDRTRVEFRESKILLSFRRGTTLALDLGSYTAQFVGGVWQRLDLSNILVDVLIGLLLISHLLAARSGHKESARIREAQMANKTSQATSVFAFLLAHGPVPGAPEFSVGRSDYA